MCRCGVELGQPNHLLPMGTPWHVSLRDLRAVYDPEMHIAMLQDGSRHRFYARCLSKHQEDFKGKALICWKLLCLRWFSDKYQTYTDVHRRTQTYGDIQTYIHTYIPTYLHTYIPTYLHTYIPTYLHAYMPTYLHTYIHTGIQTDIHTIHTIIQIHTHTYTYRYIQSFIHTYIHTYITCVYGCMHLTAAATSICSLD